MRFELEQPESIEEAAALLARRGDEARVIAGGQSLLLMIRTGLVRPAVLVSLGLITELQRIETLSGGVLRVGALATHRHILASGAIMKNAALLADAARRIGSTPVRNFGTIGGNLCHNEMGSDPPSALLALNAEVECLSARGKRKVPLDAFVTGYFETSLAPDEIVTRIEIPPVPSGAKAVYLKHTTRAGDLAIVGVAVLLDFRNGACRDARIALGGVGPAAFRATAAEKLLTGEAPSDEIIEEAAAAAAGMADPISDAHASADYRKKMVRVFVKRAIKQAMGTGRGEHSSTS
jgi:carbon-monoxide dehydrogenase medium subunit